MQKKAERERAGERDRERERAGKRRERESTKDREGGRRCISTGELTPVWLWPGPYPLISHFIPLSLPLFVGLGLADCEVLMVPIY